MLSRFEKLVFGIIIWTFVASSCIACVYRIERIYLNASAATQKKYYTSVVRLLGVPSGDNPQSRTSTGWAVSKDYILTAGHVCSVSEKLAKQGRTKDKLLVQGSDNHGQIGDIGYASIIKYEGSKFDYSHDICLIELKDHGLTPLPLMSSNVLEVEDHLYIIGAPQGYFPVPRQGQLISLLSPFLPPWKDMLFIAGDIQRGSSGSPIIWGGYVIGMAASLPSKLHNGVLAVKGEYLIEFVKDYVD